MMMRSVTSMQSCGVDYVLTLSNSAKLHLEYPRPMLVIQ